MNQLTQLLDHRYGVYGGSSKFEQLLEQGVSQEQIARQFNVSVFTVGRWVKRYRKARV